jgi:L-alanine-DL-glutamate epimerase-like enolase superfamily enzyme
VKITEVSLVVVAANFDWNLVRIATDEGLYGWGEAFFAPGLDSAVREIGTYLIGRNPLQVEPLVHDLWQRLTASGPSGVVSHVVSALETALWDILGRYSRLPLWQLWGGALRRDIPVYVDCHAGDALESLDALLQPRQLPWQRSRSQWQPIVGQQTTAAGVYTPEAYAGQARRMVEHGYHFLKFDLDVPTPFNSVHEKRLNARQIDYLVSLMAAVREAVGPQIEIAADCHWKFLPDDAVVLARELEPLRLAWLEDPVSPDSIDGLAYVQSRTTLPILTGENYYGVQPFWTIMSHGAARLIGPDFHKCGGLSIARLIGQLADLCQIPIVPHNIASPLGTMAAAHVCGTLTNFWVLEWHGESVPFWNAMLTSGPIIKEGRIRLGDSPGLGVEPNLDTLKHYRRQTSNDEPFSNTGPGVPAG